MIQAFIVYFVLLYILIAIALKGDFRLPDVESQSKRFFKISIYSIFIFSLVIGLRYYVGGDYKSYLDDYNYFNIQNSYSDLRYEIGFFILMFVLKLIDANFIFLFLFVAFLQIFFIYRWARHYKFLLVWVIFFYFTTLYLFESLNIIRQALAFSILLTSTIYIIKSDKVKFFLMVLLAASFHKSAIVFIPFIFFINKEWVGNKYIRLSLLALSFISSQFLFVSFFQNVKYFAELLDYQGYSEFSSDLFLEKNKENLGFGIYFLLLVDSVILLFSDKLQHVFKNKSFTLFNNLFFIGALLSAAFGGTNSLAIGRFIFYFVSFRMVALSFLCYYLINLNKNKFNFLIGVSIILLYLTWFILAILKEAAWCSPFQFFFQETIPLRY